MQLIDSLTAAGNALRLLAPDFPAVQFLAERVANSAHNYWSLLRELDMQLPAATPLWVFTPDRLAFFRGERPTLQRAAHWFSVPAPRENRDDRFTASTPADSATALILYDARREEEARYMRTALETVVEFGELAIAIQSHFIRENIAAAKNTKWLFWLAEQPVPEILLQQIESGLCLISDAGAGEYESVDSRIVMHDQRLEIFPRLQRRVTAANKGVALWTDGFGAPLLESERLGKGWHYRFHSRFHPAWNDLVLNAVFPAWLHALLIPSEINSDQRRLSAAQSRPNTQTAAAAPAFPFTTTRLHAAFWLLAAVLFAVERWLAARRMAN